MVCSQKAKHQVVRVLMMLNAKSVDHLPYRRHVHRKEKRAQNRDPRNSRGEPHSFRPLRTYRNVLRPVCDEGLYSSTDGIADGKVCVDACTKDRVVNGIERGRDVERE